MAKINHNIVILLLSKYLNIDLCIEVSVYVVIISKLDPQKHSFLKMFPAKHCVYMYKHACGTRTHLDPNVNVVHKNTSN